MRRRGAALSAFFAVLSAGAAARDASLPAVVIATRLEGPYAQVVEGLKKSGLPIGRIFSMESEKAQAESYLSSLSTGTSAGIVALGIEAVHAARKAPAGLPVAYTMVMDSQAFPDRPSAGVVIRATPEQTAAALQRLFPRARRAAILFAGDQVPPEAKALESAFGARSIALTAVPIPVVERLTEIVSPLAGKVDVVALTPHAFFGNPVVLDFVSQFSTRAKVPVLGLSPFHIRAGAAAAISADFVNIGVQTAERFKRVAREKVPYSRTEPPRMVLLHVGATIFRRLGLVLPAPAPDIVVLE